MIDFNGWFNRLTGGQAPEDDDPVSRTLRLLGGPAEPTRGVFGAPEPSSVPFLADEGPREALPGSIGATPSISPMSPFPEPVAPAPAAPPSQLTRYVPSYAPQAAQVTPEMAPSRDPLPVLGQAVTDAYQAAEPYLTGPARTPPSLDDPLAPVREVVGSPMFRPWTPALGYLATQQALSAPIAEALTEGASETPIFRATVPEQVPLVGGAEIAPSPRDVGRYAVQSALDPFTWATVPGSGTPVRAAVEALPLVGEAVGVGQLGRAALRGAGRAASGLVDQFGRALTSVPPTLPEGAMELGGGAVARIAPGLRTAAYNAAQGGFVGGGSEVLQAQAEGRETDPAEMARRGLVGAGLGLAAGRYAGRAGRAAAQELGSGVVPERGPARARGPIPGQQAIRMTPDQEAGRLRLDKFPAELRPTIQQAAERTGFAHEARRGVIPDAAAEDAADAVGRSVDDWVSRSKLGQTLNTEETRALRNVVTGQSQVVNDLTRELTEAQDAGLVTDVLLARVHTEGEKLASLVSVMEGARAEAGRGLRAWMAQTRPTNPSEAAARIFNKFGGGPEARQRAIDAVQEFAQIPPDDPIAQAQFWARVERGGTIRASDILTAIRYNSMLSSPRTWEVGWLGSILQVPLKVASDVMAAAARPMSGELGEAAKGTVAGVLGGFRPMWETIRHGITSEQALAGQLPRGLAARATTPTGRALGTLVDLPGRMVAAPDAFFTSIFTGAEKGRQAAIAAYKQGLKGEARTQFIADFMASPPKESAAEIERVVNDLMLRGDMGRFGRFASRMATSDPLIASFIAPFMKVSYHIWTQGLDLTPVGALGTAVDVARGAYRGGARPTGVKPLAERARMNAIGLGITGAATYQALAGNVSGRGPDDPEQRDMLRAQGWQPYSVKVGDTWVSYANWGPVAVPLAGAAAYAENQRYGKPDASREEQLFDLAKRTTGLVTEQTFLQGIGTIMNALEDPQRYAPQFLSQQLSSLIPYGSMLNTLGQAQDPYQRRADRPADVGAVESIRQNIVGRIPINPLTPDRSDIARAQDPLGRAVENPMTGPAALQPFRVSPERPDALIQAFTAAGVDIPRPKDTLTVSGTPIELTADEQRQWQRLRGERLERLAGPLVARDSWASMRPEMRQDRLRDVLASSGEAADLELRKAIGAAEVNRRVREARTKKAG